MAGGVGKSANEEVMAIAEAARLRKERDGLTGLSDERETAMATATKTSGTRSDEGVYVDFDGKMQSAKKKKKWYDFWS